MTSTRHSPTVTLRLDTLVSHCDPAWVAFFASLALSAMAIYRMDDPNRDGMLYLQTAELFKSGGVAAARSSFDWVFFPVLIGLVSKFSGLSSEVSGYAISALLLAGVCATLVRITVSQFGGNVAWSACLVALSLPAFNHYRDFLIREFGFWLFCLLAILAALRWVKRPTWGGGLTIQACIALASLFRLEAIAFYAALALWQLAVPQEWRQRVRHLLMLLGLPISGGLLLAGMVATHSLDISERIEHYTAAVNPATALARFRLSAQQFAAAALNHYSEREASSILFFGLFSMIPKKFVLMSGAFIIPLVWFFRTGSLRQKIAAWQPAGWFFAVYVIVLTAFTTFSLFLSGRYVSFLNILSVPLIAVGLCDLLDRLSRWRYVLIGIALLIALANVVSFAPETTQFRAAGRWLAEHAQLAPRTYIGSPRSGYYAGAAYRAIWNSGMAPESIAQAVHDRRFEYYVLELDRRDAKEGDWIRSLNLTEVERFAGKTGDTVLILRQESEGLGRIDTRVPNAPSDAGK